MKRIILLLAHTVLGVFLVTAQDCSSPIIMCSDVTTPVDSTTFSSVFADGCFSATNASYFTFTTNNISGNPTAFTPYTVQASAEVERCIDAGLEIPVTMGIYQPATPNDFCGALTEVAPCVTDSNFISMNTGQLLPNTTYVLVLGINPTSAGFGCDVNLTLSGAPLGIEAFADQNIALGESSDPLNVYGTTPVFGVESYVWSPVGSLDDFQSATPIATPSVTTTYTVEADVGTCLVSDQVTITVNDAVTVFNAFSPNGDGFNDTWKINRIESFDSASINVYDRWGQRVYKTIGYNEPWDGTNDGKRLSTGTYYYVIELNSLTVVSEPITGYVVILN